MWGRLPRCPFEWWAPPQSPLLSLTCSLRARGCPARAGQARPGTRAGARAGPNRNTSPKPLGSTVPTRQELKHTLASRWQMTGTSFLMTNSSSSCCWRLLLHSPPVPVFAGPQTAWGACCGHLCGRAEEERAPRGHSLARRGNRPRCLRREAKSYRKVVASVPGLALTGK